MAATIPGAGITTPLSLTTSGSAANTLELKSTNADANVGPIIKLTRDSASPADGDTYGSIDFFGDNDAGESTRLADVFAVMSDVSDSAESARLAFRANLSGTMAEMMRIQHIGSAGSNTGEVVINEDSNDINFRIESNGNANMVKVDAGSDFVMIGGGSRVSDAIFNVLSSANAKTIEVDNTNASFAQDMLRFDITRSGNTAYNFLRMMSGNSSDSEFIIGGAGDCNADGTFNANGADYAEFFETNDGNAIAVGKTVVLDGNKVRASTSSDDAATVIGVVRPKVDGINSMMIGNTAWNSWTNKYMHDDYGRFVMEDYTVTEWVTGTSEDGVENTLSYETGKIPEDVEVPSDATVKTLQRKKLNSDYDESKEYKPRSERDEWVIIGMLGQIQVEKGQTVGDRWIKMKDISETTEEWLVR